MTNENPILEELRIKIVNKMIEDNVTQDELSEAIGVSRHTVGRFLTGGKNVSRQTRKALEGYLEGKVLKRIEKKNSYLPKIRVTTKQYQFFHAQAERTNTSIGNVLSGYVEDIVTNDYLWEDYGKHVEMTERAMKSVIEKNLVPFFKIHDKSFDRVHIEIEYLLQTCLRILSDYDPKDISLQDKLKELKNIVEEEYYKGLRRGVE